MVTDRWNLCCYIILLHGIGALLPWNMFITAKNYFVDYKLHESGGDVSSHYATYFMNWMGVAAQVPSIIFNWLNIFVSFGGNLTVRVVVSIMLELIVFTMTVLLGMLDSSTWISTFFWLTIISVFLINMANAIWLNTMFGITATLPLKYTATLVLGTNISGLFTSIVSICSNFVFNSNRTAGIYYFLTAVFVLFLCLNTYLALPLNKFFRHYQIIAMEYAKTRINDNNEKTPKQYWQIFKSAFPQLFNIFFIFFVTLSLFPSLHSDIQQTREDFIVPKNYFTPITCFFTFDAFAVLGSLLSTFVHWPEPKYLVIPVTLRVLFIPLFLFCNYLPSGVERHLPILITNEWMYVFIAASMAFTSGYFSAVAMMYVPLNVEPKYQLIAGMFGAAMLLTGILCGILLSFTFPYIVSLSVVSLR